MIVIIVVWVFLGVTKCKYIKKVEYIIVCLSHKIYYCYKYISSNMEYIKKQIKRIQNKRAEYNILSQMLLSKHDTVKDTLKLYISEDDMIYVNDIIGYKITKDTNISEDNIPQHNIPQHNIPQHNIPKYNTNTNDETTYMSILYKKLALKIHPDKIIFSNIDNINNGDFSGINASYKNHDVIALLEYAIKYRVLSYVEDNINEVVIDLEKEYVSIKKELKKIRNSILYMLITDMDNSIKMVIDMINLKRENEMLKIKIHCMTQTRNQDTDSIKFST